MFPIEMTRCIVGHPVPPARRGGGARVRGRPQASVARAVAAAVLGAAALMPIGARHARANPVLVVTKKADTGAHTLREAITIANSTPGPT